MASNRELKVTVLGDASGGRRALNELGDDADRTEGRLGKLSGGIGALGAVAATGFGAAAVGAGLFLKGAFTEADTARKGLAQTEAVLKSTGGQAGVTGQSVTALADRLEALTGINDNTIVANENLLLTFTNVKNEVGAGNDVFDQANQTILDMSVALGQDGKASAIQLGKALNDPIAGVSALAEVGVTFTAQQKEQIKTLQESGDTLGAQKIILAELNKEFGGSAEAAVSPIDKLKTAFGNIQETVGTALMPTLATVATFLADRLPATLAKASEVFKEIAGPVRAFFAAFKAGDGDVTSSGFAGEMEKFGNSARRVVDVVREHWPQIRETMVGVIDAVVGFVRANWPLVKQIITETVTTVVAVIGGLIGWVRENWPQIKQVIATTIDGIVVVIDALVGWVRENWPKISQIVSETLTTVGAVVRGFVDIVMTIWNQFGSQILTVIQGAWTAIYAVINGAFTAIFAVVSGALQVIQGIIKTVTSLIKGDWAGVWEGIRQIFGGVWEAIQGILSGAWEAIQGILRGALGIMQGVLSAGLEIVVGIFRSLPRRILDGLGDLGGLLVNAGRSVIEGMMRGIDAVGDGLFGFFTGLPRRILDALGNIGGVLVSAGRDIIDGLLDGIYNGFQRVRDALSNLTNLLPDWKGPAVKDATLLYNAGQLVISGFVGGLESQFGAVEGSLGRLTGMVGVGMPSGSSGASGSLTGLQAGGTSSGVTWTGDLIVQGTRDPKETARMVLAEFQKMSDRGQRLLVLP